MYCNVICTAKSLRISLTVFNVISNFCSFLTNYFFIDSFSEAEEIKRNYETELQEEKQLNRELVEHLNVLEQSVKEIKKELE